MSKMSKQLKKELISQKYKEKVAKLNAEWQLATDMVVCFDAIPDIVTIFEGKDKTIKHAHFGTSCSLKDMLAAYDEAQLVNYTFEYNYKQIESQHPVAISLKDGKAYFKFIAGDVHVAVEFSNKSSHEWSGKLKEYIYGNGSGRIAEILMIANTKDEANYMSKLIVATYKQR